MDGVATTARTISEPSTARAVRGALLSCAAMTSSRLPPSARRATGRALTGGGLAALTLGLAGHALAERRDAALTVSVWSAPDGSAGGETYGDAPAAFVVQRRDVDVGAGGEVRFPGVAATIDAATVDVRSLTEPAATVVEQRLLGTTTDVEELLRHQIGRPVVLTLAKGELRGTLRAVSYTFVVVETDGANGKGVELVRRGDQLVDLRFAAGDVAAEPTLVWTFANARAGKQTLELSYHAEGLRWAPSYTAVIGDDDAVDLAAWATIANRSGLDLDGAQVTLAWHDPAQPAPGTFKVPRPITLPADHDVQVELAPRRTGVRGKRVTVYEAATDLSSGYTSTPAADCYGYTPSAGHGEIALEVDGAGAALPPGRLRVLRRSGGATTLARDERLRVDRGTGTLRIKVGDAPDITGERTAVSCEGDPTGRTLREEIKITVENHGKAAADVVIRDYLFRWKNWRIEAEDIKGTRVDGQAQEYRLRVVAGGSRSVSYTVVYSW